MGHIVTLFGNQITPPDVANLKLWFDATDTSSLTFNSGNISQWNDKSGKASHAAQGTAITQPKYVASGINGFPALEGRWDGTNTSQLVITDNVNLDYTNCSAFIVAMRVTDMGAASESMAAKYLLTGNQREHLLQFSATKKPIITVSNDGTAITNLSTTSIAALTTPFIADFRFAASDLKITINNETPTSNSGVASLFNGTGNYTFFSRPTLSDPFAGRIGEYIFYDRVLTADERLKILAYLSQKWRITLS